MQAKVVLSVSKSASRSGHATTARPHLTRTSCHEKLKIKPEGRSGHRGGSSPLSSRNRRLFYLQDHLQDHLQHHQG